MGRLPNLMVEQDVRYWVSQSREVFVQHAVASLLVAGTVQGWNRPHELAEEGLSFIDRLDGELFPPRRKTGTPAFYVNLALHPGEGSAEGGLPDLAVLWRDRLLLVELKTEPGSETEGQIDKYAALGTHHYPGHVVDLVYLTPREMGRPPRAPGVGYANVTLATAGPWLQAAWKDAAAEDAWAVDQFVDYLRVLEPGGTAARPRADSPPLRDMDEFDAELREQCGDEAVAIAERLRAWAAARGLRVTLGSGRTPGTCRIHVPSEKTIMLSIGTDCVVRAFFADLARHPPFDDDAERTQLVNGVNEVSGVDLAEDAKYPSLPLRRFRAPDEFATFLAAWEWALRRFEGG